MVLINIQPSNYKSFEEFYNLTKELLKNPDRQFTNFMINNTDDVMIVESKFFSNNDNLHYQRLSVTLSDGYNGKTHYENTMYYYTFRKLYNDINKSNLRGLKSVIPNEDMEFFECFKE